MVAIVDYGVGNLFSLQSSFAAIGAEVTVTNDPAVLALLDQNYVQTNEAMCRRFGYEKEDQKEFAALSNEIVKYRAQL